MTGLLAHVVVVGMQHCPARSKSSKLNYAATRKRTHALHRECPNPSQLPASSYGLINVATDKTLGLKLHPTWSNVTRLNPRLKKRRHAPKECTQNHKTQMHQISGQGPARMRK